MSDARTKKTDGPRVVPLKRKQDDESATPSMSLAQVAAAVLGFQDKPADAPARDPDQPAARVTSLDSMSSGAKRPSLSLRKADGEAESAGNVQAFPGPAASPPQKK